MNPKELFETTMNPSRRKLLRIDLTDAVWRVRGYGDFLSYCLLAEGAVDIAAEIPIRAHVQTFPLAGAQEALDRLGAGAIDGSAVLTL